MRDWHGADIVGSTGRWLVLLTSVTLGDSGTWRYVYSVRPGVNVTVVVPAGPVMLSPYDTYFTRFAAAAGRCTEPWPEPVSVPDPGML